MPATILCGVDDPATPVRDAEHLARVLPHTRLQLLPRTGHLLPIERPEACADEVVRKLTEMSSDGKGLRTAPAVPAAWEGPLTHNWTACPAARAQVSHALSSERAL